MLRRLPREKESWIIALKLSNKTGAAKEQRCCIEQALQTIRLKAVPCGRKNAKLLCETLSVASCWQQLDSNRTPGMKCHGLPGHVAMVKTREPCLLRFAMVAPPHRSAISRSFAWHLWSTKKLWTRDKCVNIMSIDPSKCNNALKMDDRLKLIFLYDIALICNVHSHTVSCCGLMGNKSRLDVRTCCNASSGAAMKLWVIMKFHEQNDDIYSRNKHQACWDYTSNVLLANHPTCHPELCKASVHFCNSKIHALSSASPNFGRFAVAFPKLPSSRFDQGDLGALPLCNETWSCVVFILQALFGFSQFASVVGVSCIEPCQDMHVS